MYKEIPPPKQMSSFLEAIWLSKGETDPSNILPDNCSDIIINLQSSKQVKFVGNMTKNLEHKPIENEILLGLRFKPAFSITFIDYNMPELTDQIVDLTEVSSYSFFGIADKYQETGEIPFSDIYDKLTEMISSFSLDSDMEEAIHTLKKTFGQIKIQELAKQIGISQRMLEKKFSRYVGKSPKRFAQIERINAIISGNVLFSDLNYYDQSHMSKEIKLLSGKPISDLFQ